MNLPQPSHPASAIRGVVLTPHGWVQGTLHHEQGRITQVQPEREGLLTEALARASGLPLVLPGFIDLHVHGGGGRDIMEGGDAAGKVSRMHARFGTTSLLATTMTAPYGDIEQALLPIGQMMAQRPAGTARILGIHLEGPFINQGKLGAQPNYARQATLEEVRQLDALARILLITLAPEAMSNRELIAPLRQMGMNVQLGHTLGTYEDGLDALKRGARGFTHLFNAMTGLHHREPGMVGAAMAHAEFAEIIPDLIHVHPGAIHAAMRCIPKLFCVTDSTSAAGMPDGNYLLGRHQVIKCMGGVRLADGTLAGSTLTMDQALRNLVGLGLTVAEASNRVSTFAADYLDLQERGRLVAGAWADLVLLDPESLALQSVHVEGEAIELADAD